jgi:hypothetical protein
VLEQFEDPRLRASAASNMLDDGGGPHHQHAAQGLVASPDGRVLQEFRLLKTAQKPNM